MEMASLESNDDELCLKGNFTLLNLNLSRTRPFRTSDCFVVQSAISLSGNYLTMASVKEFLLTVQQQLALAKFKGTLGSTSTTGTSSVMDFSGLCRLELKVRVTSDLFRRLSTAFSGYERYIRGIVRVQIVGHIADAKASIEPFPAVQGTRDKRDP